LSTALSAYSDPRPESKIGRLRTALMYLIDEHRRDGALPTSVRFLFYELIARSVISKEGDRPDKIVSEALTDLRERRLVPWDDIVDETRSIEDFSGSATVADDLLLYLDAARIDPWRGDVPRLSQKERASWRPPPSLKRVVVLDDDRQAGSMQWREVDVSVYTRRN
jgi:hypothetical protein